MRINHSLGFLQNNQNLYRRVGRKFDRLTLLPRWSLGEPCLTSFDLYSFYELKLITQSSIRVLLMKNKILMSFSRSLEHPDIQKNLGLKRIR